MFQNAFNTIIVGVDFSTYSKVAVKQAQSLCKIWKTKLVLVHAIHDPVVYSPSLYMSFPNVVSEDTYVARIKKVYQIKSNQVKVLARRGTPTAVLLEVARQSTNPLLLVGHRGHGDLATFFFGSTAQSLILSAKSAVWVHRGSKIVKPARVLIPHDLSNSSNHAIDIVHKLKLDRPRSYSVYHIREKAFPVLDYEMYLKLMQNMKRQRNYKIQNILQHYPHLHIEKANGELTKKLVQKTKKFDLLVMSHHNPTGLFSKGETVELMKHVKTPMLVVP